MRIPLKMAAIATALCLLTPLVAAGCTRSADLPRCPDGGRFTAAAVWTTVYTNTSYLQFYNSTRLVAQTPLRAQGIITPGQGVLRIDDKWVFVASGDQNYNRTTIVAIGSGACQVSLTTVQQPAILDAATDGTNILLTNSVISGFDGTTGALLRWYDPAGNRLAEHNAGAGSYRGLTHDSSFTYGFLQADSDQGPGPVALEVLRNADLDPAADVPIPGLDPNGGPPASSVVLDGKLYFPMTFTNAGREDHRLGVVDVTTHSVATIDLPSASPYQVRGSSGRIYVAHTFMNPSFHPMSSYRSVSVYDPATGTVQGYTLKEGINSIAVSDTTLAAIGEDDGGTMHLHTYSLPDMKPQDDVTLTAPVGMNGGYVADVFLPN